MPTVTCPHPKCGAVLRGAESFCWLCGHPVSARWEDERISVKNNNGSAVAFGGAVVVGGIVERGTYDVGVLDLCRVSARVKGMPQVNRFPMRPGEAITLDGGDLGYFEVTLLAYSMYSPSQIDFLVTKLRDAPHFNDEDEENEEDGDDVDTDGSHDDDSDEPNDDGGRG